MASDQFSEADICEFIFKVYNISVCIIKHLKSFEDKVILVQEIHPGGHGAKYILKVLQVKKDEQILEKRITVVNCLCQNGFKCSQYLEGKDGKYIQQLETGTARYLCILYTYLPGVELENATDLRSTTLLQELGAYLGYLHKTFESISVEDLKPDSTDPWLMSNFPLLGTDEYLGNVESSSLKLKIVKVIEDAEKLFNTAQHFFKKGLIHGDFHTLNIIVDEHVAAPSEERSLFINAIQSSQLSGAIDGSQLDILLKGLAQRHDDSVNSSKETLLAKFGLIDYGEIVCTFRVLEVGRLIADLMVTILMTYYFKQVQGTESCDVQDQFDSLKVAANSFGYADSESQDLERRLYISDGGDVLTQRRNLHDIKKYISALCNVGGFILKGYFLTSSLSKYELEALKDSILISLIQYISLSENSLEEDNDNAEYNTKCREAAVVIFLELCDGNKEDLYKLWTDLL